MSVPFTPSPHCANLKMMLRAKDDPGMSGGGVIGLFWQLYYVDMIFCFQI